MRIGMPRALLHHYYSPLWIKLFQELGLETVVSEATHKHQIEKGIKVTVPEICVPIKIFNGHVVELLEQDVDFVFVPRFVSVEKDYWFCPKFMGLPELTGYSVPGAKARMLTLEFSGTDEGLADYGAYKPLCRLLGIRPDRLKGALKAATVHWQRFRALCLAGYTLEEAERLAQSDNPPTPAPQPDPSAVTLGVLGYVYNLYDPFASLEILTKLRAMGVRVFTFEMLPQSVLTAPRSQREKAIYWTFSDKLAGAGEYLLAQPEVDGLIHVTAFGCGPDSIVGKLLEMDSEACRKPMMTLRIDEHTGESHLQTRLEAFVDMIARKKRQKGGVFL